MAGMATFEVDFLGCKVSHVDAQEIRSRLLRDGHAEADAGPDLAVISTCCVTHEAVRKSRKAVYQAARRARQVYVTGCAARLPGALDSLPENVRVLDMAPERAADVIGNAVGAIGCVQDDTGLDRVRAFVKVQDGCSFGCSFCVIPRVRGASRSRSADAVVAEVRRRVAQGHLEVVLTGINLGCYRDRSAGYDLPRLIRVAGAVEGLARLRLSSVEVNHLSDELIGALRETATASRHLHVPLQSGDDCVLRDMGRRYTTSTYLRRLERADGFNVTTDVIVGFPTEDERAFDATLETIARAGITKVHVFPYSPRPGTSTQADDPVPAAVKRERSARLRAASREACLAHWRAKIGRDDLVLVDRPGKGYGDDYSPWLVDAPVGAFVGVRAGAVGEQGIVAA
jgi:threonylcarbamoyladenosine tRNA methylthiotransferase MtaB